MRKRRPVVLSISLATLSSLLACGAEPGSVPEPTAPDGPAAALEAAREPPDTSPPLHATERPEHPAAGRRSSPPFRSRIELATEGLPEGVAMIDLDGDERVELLAVTKTPGSLHLWRDLGQQPTRIELPDYSLGPIAVDLPGGRLVAVASRASREILLLDPLAREALAKATRFPLDGTPRAFGAGDLDGDGLPDLVCALREGRLVWIGSGGRTRTTRLRESQPTTLLVAPGRVIVGSQSQGCLRAYRLIAGELVADEGLLELGGIPRRLLRVERDGAELLAVAGGERDLWWIGASEAGSSWLSARLPRPKSLRIQPLAGSPGAVPIDLAAGPHGATTAPLLVRLNNGGQSFELLDISGPRLRSLAPPSYAGQDPWSACLGDLDDDGLPELAIANRGASRVSVLLGERGGGFEVAETLPVGRGPHSLRLVDLFGDARPELGVIGALSGRLEVFTREGGAFRQLHSHDASPAGDLLRGADIDADGTCDLAFLVRDDAGARVRVLWGDGAGAHRLAEAEVPAGVGVGDLLLHDLDHDGRLEMVVADPDRGELRLFRWTARSVALLCTVAVPSVPVALAAIDVDGDGVDELAVALGQPGPRTGFAILQLSSSASGTVLREAAHIESAGFGIDIESAELDGAAPRELLLLVKPNAHDGPGLLRVFGRAGAGSGWRLRAESRTGQRPYAIATGDFDGDGRDDVVVGAQNSHHVNLWRATAAGLVREADLGVGRGVLDVCFGDLDGDGRQDVVAANNFSNDISVLLVRPVSTASAVEPSRQ